MKHNLLQLTTPSCLLDIHPNSEWAYNYWKSFQHQTPFSNFNTAFLKNKLSKVIFDATRSEDNTTEMSIYYVTNNFSAFQIYNYLKRNEALPRKIVIRLETLNHKQIKRLAEDELADLFMNAVTRSNASQAFKILKELPPYLQADILKPMRAPEKPKALRQVFAKRFAVTHDNLVFSKLLSDPTDSDVLGRLNER